MKKANVDDDRKLSRRLLSTPRYHLAAVPCNLKFGKVQTQEANYIIGNGIKKRIHCTKFDKIRPNFGISLTFISKTHILMPLTAV